MDRVLLERWKEFYVDLIQNAIADNDAAFLGSAVIDEICAAFGCRGSIKKHLTNTSTRDILPITQRKE